MEFLEEQDGDDPRRGLHEGARCANSGSLMMKGHEPSPPALAELRHPIEFEPDDRALLWFSYPLTGGKYRSPAYGAELELARFWVFPASYQLNELVRLWGQTYPAHEAFEKDGLHPKAHFAMYMIEIASVDANLQFPLFHQTTEGQPIAIVLADG